LDANRSFLTYRAVRAHEANYVPMRNYLSIIACMSNVSNTESIHLTAERIQECDEDIVKPTGKGFIKQYHHFTYVSAGVIKCQYIRGQGDYKQHTLNQQIGMVSESILRCWILGVRSELELCGICGDSEDTQHEDFPCLGRMWQMRSMASLWLCEHGWDSWRWGLFRLLWVRLLLSEQVMIDIFNKSTKL
jgi:hypothetical protein